MTDFKDTSSWKKKDGSTLVYSYEHEGQHREGEIEKEPHTLAVQIEKLSVVDRMAWEFADKKLADSTTGYHAAEHIRASGQLDRSRIHAFTLDENNNETFTRLDVSIYPTELEALKAASTIERWSFTRFDEERPDAGWLKDEMGRIDYYVANDFIDKSSVSARLWLDRQSFDSLVQKIKMGEIIRTARLEVFADLYQFGYEAAFGGPYTTENFGIFCEDDGNGLRGFTNARLEEFILEWTPSLTSNTKSVSTLADEGDYLEESSEVERTESEMVIARLASDVQVIRGKIDTFYRAAYLALIYGMVFLIGRQVLDWIGF